MLYIFSVPFVILETLGNISLRAYSHQVKVGATVKKVKEQAEKDQRIDEKHQGRFSLSLPFLFGVNGS